MKAHNYEIEVAVDRSDRVVAIKPPVDSAFRERAYEMLEGLGLAREAVIRGGDFFEVKHLSDGTLYSELRLSGTALEVASQSLMGLAQASADILREQNHAVQVSPDMVPPSRHAFFERS